MAFIATPLTVEPLFLQLGEGAKQSPVDGKIYFLNVFNRQGEKNAGIYRFDPKDLDDKGQLSRDALEFCPIATNRAIGTIGFTSDPDILVAAIDLELRLINFKTGAQSFLASAHADQEGARFNDGNTDPTGRYFIVGTKARSIPGDLPDGVLARDGNLYAYDTQTGHMNVLLQNVQISNGVGWSPNGKTMYWIDTLLYKSDVPIHAFDFKPEQLNPLISNADLLTTSYNFEYPKKIIVPDGLAVLKDGSILVGFFNGGGVRRYAGNGQEVISDFIAGPDHVGQTTIPAPFLHPKLGNCVLITTAGEFTPVAELPNRYCGTPVLATGLPDRFQGLPASVLNVPKEALDLVRTHSLARMDAPLSHPLTTAHTPN